MLRRLSMGAIAVLFLLGPGAALAQFRPSTPPATRPLGPPIPDASEIKLDETTNLKAAALEARMSAVLANFALLQRQAQDLQVEYNKMLEERKALIEDAGRRTNIQVKDTNEWAFDIKGQRYIHTARPPAATPQK